MIDEPSSGRLVRPYAITKGRAGDTEDPLPLETMVVATPAGWATRSQYRWESAEIIVLTGDETAVIELAAMLELPIGVIRVLVSDLAEKGAVELVRPTTETVRESSEDDYADLLQRVLDGIKSI